MGLLLVSLTVCSLQVAVLCAQGDRPAKANSALGAEVGKAYGKLPLAFEANQGQFDPRVRFCSRTDGYTLFLTPDEFVVLLREPHESTPRSIRSGGVDSPSMPNAAVVRMRLVGARPTDKIAGLERLPGRRNYLLGGDPKQWHTDVPVYRKVRYQGVYRGIDLVFHGTNDSPEYEFIVAPGADPGRIEIDHAGTAGVAIDDQGNLVLSTAVGKLIHKAPIAYQERDGRRELVESAYVLTGNGRVRFRLGDYDSAEPLVIDPILAYSTYLGGGSSQLGRGIAVDASGCAYITGSTSSSDFPTTAGAFDTSVSGTDVFVTKLNSTGTALVYSTFLGGALGNEQGSDIAVDASGCAYVTGYTYSSDFPTQPGSFDTSHNGWSDVFVTKLNATGSALVYSGFLGGTSFDGYSGGDHFGGAIAVDPSGCAYVVGFTRSTDFPTTAGAFDTSFNGGSDDMFVTKVNATGSALEYSTYLGGSAGGGEATGVAVDSLGCAYVAGFTASSDFPTTAGAFDTTHNGGSLDAIVTKLNPAGSALVYSTYLGGSGIDSACDLAVGADGSAYVFGATVSEDLPTTAGAFDTTYNGGYSDSFVTKLNDAGSALVYSTFLGGSESDFGGTIFGGSIAVDSIGNAYLVGSTRSVDFPTTNLAVDDSHNGFADFYIAKMNPSGSALLYSTYLGGTGVDEGLDIALDGQRSVYVTGYTRHFGSPSWPTTAGAYDTTANGSYDVVVAKLVLSTPAQAIQDLVELVSSYNLVQGLSNSLDVKLQRVEEAITALKNNAYKDAIGKLQAFINEVEAQRGKALTDAQADALVAEANLVISLLL
jgi:hypothetical protein